MGLSRDALPRDELSGASAGSRRARGGPRDRRRARTTHVYAYVRKAYS